MKEEEIILKTERLSLRLLKKSDVDAIWPFVSDPEIPKLMAWDAHKEKTETLAFLDRVEQDFKTGKSITWAIEFENNLCGIFSIIAIARTHRALTYNRGELAYWLGGPYQGKGIMVEAGKKIIEFAFRNLNIHRLVVGHFTDNKASENLIKRLGFKYIGEETHSFMKRGVWFNQKLYELINENDK